MDSQSKFFNNSSICRDCYKASPLSECVDFLWNWLSPLGHYVDAQLLIVR